MMNKALLKKMAGEVSFPTLIGFLSSYVEQITPHEEVNEEVLDIVAGVDIITSEIKSRKPKKKPESKPEQRNETSTVIGNGITAGRG